MSDQENPMGTSFTAEELDQIGKGTFLEANGISGSSDPMELLNAFRELNQLMQRISARLEGIEDNYERLNKTVRDALITDPLSEEALGF